MKPSLQLNTTLFRPSIENAAAPLCRQVSGDFVLQSFPVNTAFHATYPAPDAELHRLLCAFLGV